MPAGQFRPSPNFLIQTFGSVILYDSLCGFAAFLLVSVTLLRFCSDPYPFATDAGVAGGMGCYSDWGTGAVRKRTDLQVFTGGASMGAIRLSHGSLDPW